MLQNFCWISILFALINGVSRVVSFPQGAPIEACETLSPKRGHKTNGQPLELSPYRLKQYGRRFGPGQLIGVELIPKYSNNPIPFKGFLVQAIDTDKVELSGQFVPGDGLHLLPECSAVTHNDTVLKDSVSLLWMAPSDRWGMVLFRATVVINKKYYFENIISDNRM